MVLVAGLAMIVSVQTIAPSAARASSIYAGLPISTDVEAASLNPSSAGNSIDHTDEATRDLSLQSTAGSNIEGGQNGNATYLYKFDLPTARGRVQPNLALRYSANSSSDDAGAHWALTDTYIEQDPHLSPQPVSISTPTTGLNLIREGTSKPLSPSGRAHHYSPDSAAVNEDYEQREPFAWEAREIDGTTAEFSAPNCGASSGSPSCVRWYINGMLDPDGNAIHFDHQYQDNSQDAILTRISYNDVDASNTPTTVIELTYEPDPQPSAERIGRTVISRTQRLSKVTVTQMLGQSQTLLRSYILKYTESAVTNASLLSSIQLLGSDGVTSEPPTTFEYFGPNASEGSSYYKVASPVRIGEPLAEFGASQLYCAYVHASAPCPISGLAAWIDLDGDRLPDLVFGGAHGTEGKSDLRWARNITTPGTANLTFMPITEVPGSEQALPDGVVTFGESTGELTPPNTTGESQQAPKARLMDVNGDALQDVISGSGFCSDSSSAELSIRLGQPAATGYGLGNAVKVDARLPIDAVCASRAANGATVSSWIAGDQLEDLTGDGVADFVVPVAGHWKVFPLSRGADGQWFFGAPRLFDQRDLPPTIDPDQLLDINGDGFTDFVDSGTTWKVHYGTGFGFETANPDTAIWASGDPDLASINELADPRPIGFQATRVRAGALVDLNGDGRLDYIHKQSNCAPSPCPLIGLMNTGTGFSRRHLSISVPTTGQDKPLDSDIWPYSSTDMQVQNDRHDGLFVDANGDGVVDYVSRRGGDEWWFYAGRWSSGDQADGAVPADVLKSVTSPALATTRLHFAPSSVVASGNKGPIRPVLTSVEVSGPAIEHSGVQYWYSEPSNGPVSYDPVRTEDRGFHTVAARDDTTGVVTDIRYHTEHALIGLPDQITRGASIGPPGSGPPDYLPFDQTTIMWRIKEVDSDTCNDGSVDLGASSYPVIRFGALTEHQMLSAGSSADFSASIVDCADIDGRGLIHSTRVVADDRGLPLDQAPGVVETIGYDANAICASCPVEFTEADDAGSVLTHAMLRYDSGSGDPSQALPRGQAGLGRLVFVEHHSPTDSSIALISEEVSYNTDGTIASVADVNPYRKTSYEYDRQGVRVTRVSVSDEQRTLVSDIEYDSTSGLPTLFRGPFIPNDDSPKRTTGLAYDALGRVTFAARSSLDTGSAPDASTAWEYNDATVPRSVTTHTYATPTPVQTSQPPPDVGASTISITYYDSLDRPVETRSRLGSPVNQTEDAIAHISDHLAADRWRVDSSLFYDGAGRLSAAVDPIYSGTPEFRGLPDEDGNGLIAHFSYYDSAGRLECQLVAHVHQIGDVSGSHLPCTSTQSDDDSYRLASMVSYSIVNDPTVDRRSRYYQISVLAPSENVTGQDGGRWTKRLVDASGRTAASVDAYGNRTIVQFDPLGRVMRRSVLPFSSLGGLLGVSASYSYDFMGRLATETDSDAGTRAYEYYPSGQVRAIAGPGTSVDYSYASLGRLTEVRDAGTGQILAAFDYDRPYSAESESAWTVEPGDTLWSIAQATLGDGARYPEIVALNAGLDQSDGGELRDETTPLEIGWKLKLPKPTYDFDAGRVSVARSPNSVIAVGYDADGHPTRRDQWFPGTGSYAITLNEYRSDGKLLDSSTAVPGSGRDLRYSVDYDSDARVDRIVSRDQEWLRIMPARDGVGGYDARGRPLSVATDDGLLQSTVDYSPNSSLLRSDETQLASTSVVDQIFSQYSGQRVSNWKDLITNTSYSYQYDHDGLLATAEASVLQTDGSQTISRMHVSRFSDRSTDFSRSSAPSLGIVERIDSSDDRSSVQWSYNHDYGHQGISSITERNAVTGSESTDVLGRDGSGRVTSDSASGTIYKYDALGRLTDLTTARGTTHLGYDAFGVLDSRHDVLDGAASDVAYAGPYASIAQRQGAVDSVIHVLNGTTRIASEGDADTRFFVRDRLGSVVSVVHRGTSGHSDFTYSPYGDRSLTSGGSSDPDDPGYTGAFIVSGELLMLGQREYDSQSGLFLQPDTLDFRRYSYAGLDPINVTDPSGMEGEDSGEEGGFDGGGSGEFGEDVSVFGGGPNSPASGGGSAGALGSAFAGGPPSYEKFVGPQGTMEVWARPDGVEEDHAAGSLPGVTGEDGGASAVAVALGFRGANLPMPEPARPLTAAEGLAVGMLTAPVLMAGAAVGAAHLSILLGGLSGNIGPAAAAGYTSMAAGLGKAGESILEGLDGLQARVPSILDPTRFRILDGLNQYGVTEVKNVAYQSLTVQLVDSILYAQSLSVDFNLVTRLDTELSGPLADLVEMEIVNWIPALPPGP